MKYIGTFSTSNWSGYTKSIYRLSNQFLQMKNQGSLFDNIFFCNEKCLDRIWHTKFDKYISDYGYASWSWKPYIIHTILQKIDNGDILMYLDGGCSLPITNLSIFNSKFNEIVSNISSCELKLGVGRYKNDKRNIRIVRKQILNSFNLSNNKEFLYEFPHYEAGCLILVKDEKTMSFINEWYTYMHMNYSQTIRSSFYDAKDQNGEFIHNGADQAVLQCLLYKYSQNNISFSNIETFFYDFNMVTRIK